MQDYMVTELQIIESTSIEANDKDMLDKEIERVISKYRKNSSEINKLAFASVTALRSSHIHSQQLASKGVLDRFIGFFTGSNAKIEAKINADRNIAQYATQRTLEKLAEQNLMSFDLITAVNNKLNASLIQVDKEIKEITEILVRFFRQNKSELARLESRLENVERNVNLLNWVASIEFQQYDEIDYVDLDEITKIVCITRDFFEITQNKWTTSDLLLLKSALKEIELSPKKEINYYEVLTGIAHNQSLRDKLLGVKKLNKIDEPEYMVTMAGLQKLESLVNEEHYVVKTVANYLASCNFESDIVDISDKLTAKYIEETTGVNVNTNISIYDFILELLYNMSQYNATYVEKKTESDALSQDNSVAKRLATIQRINRIESIKGATSIELLVSKNWQHIAKKGDYRAGDLCIYIENGSFIPKKNNFVLSNYIKHIKSQKLGEGFIVVNDVIYGVESHGLVQPISLLPMPADEYEEYDDVTEILGIKDSGDNELKIANDLYIKGYCWQHGYFQEKDMYKARKCYEEAAALGSKEAEVALQKIDTNYNRTEKRKKTETLEGALKRFNKAINNATKESQYRKNK